MPELADRSALDRFDADLNRRQNGYVSEPMGGPLAYGSIILEPGPLNLAIVQAARLESHRPATTVTEDQPITLLLPRDGEVTVEQSHRSATIGSGSAMLLDPQAPCSLRVPIYCDATLIDIWPKTLRQLGVEAGHIYGRPVYPGRRISSLLRDMFDSELSAGLQDDEGDARATQDAIAALIAVAVHQRSDRFPDDDGRLEQRMRDWVTERIRDPALTPEALASHFGLSRRSLFRQFAALGTTPSKWLWNLRLECARERLLSGRGLVSTIAYSVGFTDAGHFSRLYRLRFQETPTATRDRR